MSSTSDVEMEETNPAENPAENPGKTPGTAEAAPQGDQPSGTEIETTAASDAELEQVEDDRDDLEEEDDDLEENDDLGDDLNGDEPVGGGAAGLLAALGLGGSEPEEQPELEDTPFSRSLKAALQAATKHLIDDGLIEINEQHIDNFVLEMTLAGADANSPKHMMRKLMKTLTQSDRLEEIYGTDEMLEKALRKFMGG